MNWKKKEESLFKKINLKHFKEMPILSVLKRKIRNTEDKQWKERKKTKANASSCEASVFSLGAAWQFSFPFEVSVYLQKIADLEKEFPATQNE